MTPQEYINNIRQLIAKDRPPKALELLQALLQNSPLLDEAITQSARFPLFIIKKNRYES